MKIEFIPLLFDSVLRYEESGIKCRFCGETAVEKGFFTDCCKEKIDEVKGIKDVLGKKYQKRQELEAQTKKLRYINMIALTGLGTSERRYTLKKWVSLAKTPEDKKKLSSIAEDAKNSIRHGKSFLVFSGTVGTGKTGLAISLAKEMCWKEDNDFLIYRCSTQEEQERRAFTVPVLILDDIGRETGIDLKIKLKRGFITDILLKRYVNGKQKTILTTNLSQSELLEAFGSHVCDRIFSDCSWHEFNFESWRRNK